MILKHVLTLVFIAAFTSTVFGQAAPKDTTVFKHQIGINTTLFIQQFLNFSNNNILFDNPYLFTYKHIGNKASGLRAGIGFSFLNSKSSTNGGTGIVPDSIQNKFYLRVGYEKQMRLSKHWIGYAGIDVRYQTNKTKISTAISPPPQSEVSSITTKNMNIGLGPVLGFEFIINKRMSLNAEATVLYFYTEQRKKVEDTKFPSLNSSNFTAKSTTSISVPTTIFFVVKL